jgi:hypothetical protein
MNRRIVQPHPTYSNASQGDDYLQIPKRKDTCRWQTAIEKVYLHHDVCTDHNFNSRFQGDLPCT